MSTSHQKQPLSRRRFVIGSSALAAAAFSGGLWECASGEQPGSNATPGSADQNIADIVLRNGHVQTMVSESDVASAVAIAGNKIVYVGDDSGIDAFVGDKTQVIDLDGKFVSPGFIDGHIHAPANWFNALFQIDLTGLTTNEEYLKAIAPSWRPIPTRRATSERLSCSMPTSFPTARIPGPRKKI